MNLILIIYALLIASFFLKNLVLRKLNESFCSETGNKAEIRC